MSTRRGRRLAFTWVALFAILMVTFAPSVTGLFSQRTGLPWDLICSAVAPIRDHAASTDSQPAPHTFDHCPYCALHADLAPPPQAAFAGAGITVAFRAVPSTFLQAPRSNGVWVSAQPRAPPVLS
jgi:hypothetical protein